jgi:hypothetical protein
VLGRLCAKGDVCDLPDDLAAFTFPNRGHGVNARLLAPPMVPRGRESYRVARLCTTEVLCAIVYDLY